MSAVSTRAEASASGTDGRALTWLRWVALVIGALSLTWPYRHDLLPTDLHVYVKGGHAVLHGADLYGPTVAVQGYPFTYPPFAALPFAALAPLPTWLIIVATCAVFYASLAVVVQCCAPGLLRRAGGSWASWLPLIAILAFNPVWATLHDGQVNMLLAALVLHDVLRGRRARGTLVGVAAAVKLTPAVFVVYFLVTRQWSAARNAVLGFAGCTGLAWAILPADSWKYWTHSLYDTSRVGDIGRVSNQSVLGLATKEFDGPIVHVVWVVLGAAVAVLTLWTAARLHDRGFEVLAVGFVGVLGCLLSPITWTHHWVWAVPLLLGTVRTPLWRSRRVQVVTLVACAVFLHGAAEAPPRIPVLHLVLGNLYTLTGLVLIASAAWAMLTRPRVRA